MSLRAAAAPSASPLFKRHLATVVNPPEATGATASSTASTSSPSVTVTIDGLTPENATSGPAVSLSRKVKTTTSDAAWPSRRTPQPVPDSAVDKAQTIYLPNLVFRLVRNSPKEAKNPYIATFRVPVQLTKPDIVSYLWQVYGLKVTSISTITEMGEKKLTPGAYVHERRKKNTKKAILGMEQPFWFPEKRSEEWLNDHFEKKTRADYLRRRLLPVGDGGPGRGRRSWRWRGSSLTTQGIGSRYSEIMRRIRERREQQETVVAGLARKEEKALVKKFKTMSAEETAT